MLGFLRVLLARHGETEWNAIRRVQGHSDIPLNERGHAQAADLARRLESIPLDHIYTSTLQRSIQTAEPLAVRAPTTQLEELNEQAMGMFEGKQLRGPDATLADAFRARRRDPTDTLDGGESLAQHARRAMKAMELIRLRHTEGHVLVVAHGGTNVVLIMELLGLSYEEALEYRQQNADVHVIDFVGDLAVVRPLEIP